MSNIEYRPAIKFSTWKGLNSTEISKELTSIYKDDAPSYRTVAKWVAEFKEPEPVFEDSPEQAVYPSPPLMKTLKPYNGLEYVIGKSLLDA